MLERQEAVNLGDVAMFIGAALNHPMPPGNGMSNMVSTIKVAQYKIKFSEIRVYCNLAEPGLIKEYWSLLKREEDPTPEFIARCRKSDALHYRRVYLAMLQFLPSHIKPSIVDSSDYRELLYETPEELNGFIEAISKREDLQYYLKRWRVDDISSLKTYLFDVCRFPAI